MPSEKARGSSVPGACNRSRSVARPALYKTASAFVRAKRSSCVGGGGFLTFRFRPLVWTPRRAGSGLKRGGAGFGGGDHHKFELLRGSQADCRIQVPTRYRTMNAPITAKLTKRHRVAANAWGVAAVFVSRGAAVNQLGVEAVGIELGFFRALIKCDQFDWKCGSY